MVISLFRVHILFITFEWWYQHSKTILLAYWSFRRIVYSIRLSNILKRTFTFSILNGKKILFLTYGSIFISCSFKSISTIISVNIFIIYWLFNRICWKNTWLSMKSSIFKTKILIFNNLTWSSRPEYLIDYFKLWLSFCGKWLKSLIYRFVKFLKGSLIVFAQILKLFF